MICKKCGKKLDKRAKSPYCNRTLFCAYLAKTWILKHKEDLKARITG